MKNFKKNIPLQQQSERGTEIKVADDMNSFFTQDILKDRIKAIEKKFSEIKTNFHKNLSSIS